MRQSRGPVGPLLRAVALLLAVGSSGLPLGVVTLPCLASCLGPPLSLIHI